MLNWSLVVCTLNRREILETGLRTAITQTRLPKQIIVVDASDTWELSKEYILGALAQKSELIQWIYVGSDQKSLSRQRNIGLQYCTSEIVFFFDDDSMMYPDCAEYIMQVYENDTKGLVGGVSALLAEIPPASAFTHQASGQLQENDCTQPQQSAPSLKTRLVKRFSCLWNSEKLFVPYDGHFYTYELPELAQQTLVLPEVLLHGCRMTFKTAIVREVGGFDEVLIRAAISEDDDISYRISRQFALVSAEKARIFHMQTEIARLKRFPNTVLMILNISVLFLLNSTSGIRSILTVYKFAFTRLVLEVVRDSVNPQRGFPHTRGVLYALLWLSSIVQMTQQELRDWYPNFQAKLLDSKKVV